MSDGGWCVCDYDSEPSYCNTVTEPVARKEHRCDECSGPIVVGERYQVWRAVSPEYGWMAYKACRACLDGPAEFCERNCGCVPWGTLADHLSDVAANYPFEREETRERVRTMVEAMVERGREYREQRARDLAMAS